MSAAGTPMAQDVVRPSITQIGSVNALPVTNNALAPSQIISCPIPSTVGNTVVAEQVVSGDSNYFYAISARFREVIIDKP
jgi:hypothetical protein